VGRRTLAGSLAGLTLLACVSACGTSQVQSTTSSALSSEISDYPVVTRVEPRLLQTFFLFRAPPAGLPAAIRSSTPIYGANLMLARRVPTTPFGNYWLIPADDHLCIMAQGVGGGPGISTTCEQTASALKHGIADITITLANPATHTPELRLIVGVAPDGTRQAIVHTRGMVETAPVLHGVFALSDSIVAPPDFFEMRH
jgi:hypothetical protein